MRAGQAPATPAALNKSRSGAAFSACLLVGFASGAQAQVTTTGPLRVGAAKVDITPGLGDLPKHYLGALDRVYSRAIVIDNGATTAALVTVDVIMLSNAVADCVNDRIASELGIPVQHIVLAGTGCDGRFACLPATAYRISTTSGDSARGMSEYVRI